MSRRLAQGGGELRGGLGLSCEEVEGEGAGKGETGSAGDSGKGRGQLPSLRPRLGSAGREADSRESSDSGEEEEFMSVEEKEASEEGLFQEEAAEDSRNSSEGEDVDEFSSDSRAASVGALGRRAGLAGFLGEEAAGGSSRRESSGGGALGGVDEHSGCRENKGHDTSSGESGGGSTGEQIGRAHV